MHDSGYILILILISGILAQILGFQHQFWVSESRNPGIPESRNPGKFAPWNEGWTEYLMCFQLGDS